MHCDLFVFKPKGSVVNTDELSDRLITSTNADYLGDDITDRNEEHYTKVRESLVDTEKAKEYLRLVKEELERIVSEFDPSAPDSYVPDELKDAMGDYVAIIDKNGYIEIDTRFKRAYDLVRGSRMAVCPDYDLVVYDYHC